MMTRNWLLRIVFLQVVLGPVAHAQQPQRVAQLECFPAFTQFSPVPTGRGWKGEEGPLTPEVMRATIDEIRAHGFTGLESPVHRPPEEAKFILDYAQSQGMIVVHHTNPLELFGRDEPPKVCVYSPEYATAVLERVRQALAPLKDIPRLYGVFTYQDEPFHWGPKSFGYNAEVRAEFKKRYGYDLPPDLATIRDDPQKWLDVINFRTDYFPDGWRQVYKIIKEADPGFRTILTHDSHNTFGAGYGSHAELAIDDVFHWGGDFADMFVFDIYPYMMFDFRFGEPARAAQTADQPDALLLRADAEPDPHLRQGAGVLGRHLQPAWFKDFMGPELQAKHWAEREMSTTAVAQGADFLLTGWGIPTDARHWESLGEGLRLIQKAGPKLLDAPKVKAKACMLFPRTQYVQLQEEYFNVGLSFELFLRAFGELDILHEEQVKDDRLDGYQIVVLFDVKLLPGDGGRANRVVCASRAACVMADCVPCWDAQQEADGDHGGAVRREGRQDGPDSPYGSLHPERRQAGVGLPPGRTHRTSRSSRPTTFPEPPWANRSTSSWSAPARRRPPPAPCSRKPSQGNRAWSSERSAAGRCFCWASACRTPISRPGKMTIGRRAASCAACCGR